MATKRAIDLAITRTCGVSTISLHGTIKVIYTREEVARLAMAAANLPGGFGWLWQCLNGNAIHVCNKKKLLGGADSKHRSGTPVFYFHATEQLKGPWEYFCTA